VKTAKLEFSITSFSYRHFGWMGRILGRAFYSNSHTKLETTLDDTGLRIYPEAYFSLIGFILILSVIVTIPIVLFTGFILLVPAPILVILLGYAIPKIIARDRASKLDLEVPFAGTYISVMATGGLSPYASLKRLKDCNLLPNISKVIKDIEIDVQIEGLDPVTAMEKSAEHLPSKDYKDLMLGYASTLRTGGDVIHYLLIRTETMFKDLAVKVKAFGERASVLMESYITISILMTLTLTIIFMTSLSFQQFWQGSLSADTFLIYAYFIVPTLAMLFIFLSDAQQISQPLSEWGPYKVFFATSPIMLFLILTMFLPFAAPQLAPPFAKPFMDFITLFRQTLGLDIGYEATLGMGVALLAGSIPAAIAHSYYTRKGKAVEHDVTNFLRDLTEARKSGASPERCMENLSGRNYGGFTKILTAASRQIAWGFPFRVIYETFKTKIKSWLALINIYLLVDAIEVGGGTPETLETLTHFSEELSSLEKEKKETLRPLLLMPYIGAGILLFSTIIFLGFSRTILSSFGHQALPFSMVVTLLLPPIMVQTFFTGLVTGKLSSGSVSAGFKHAIVLIIVGLILLPLAGYLTLPFIGGT
jgi:flagellar protein FlaJ